jgi:hypothetical protein
VDSSLSLKDPFYGIMALGDTLGLLRIFMTGIVMMYGIGNVKRLQCRNLIGVWSEEILR